MTTKTRALVGALTAAVALVVGATVASAHVTVNPSEATKGGFTKLTFRVPNESDTASTTSLRIILPEDVELRLRTRPLPGWDVEVEARGDSTGAITWSGGAIAPGEFQEFEVSGGPLPDDVDSIAFLAEQTYDDGEVVRWFDPVVPGEEEPQHPAPTLTLVDGAEDEVAAGSTDSDGDDGTDPFAVAALALAVVALVLAGQALRRASGDRRR